MLCLSRGTALHRERGAATIKLASGHIDCMQDIEEDESIKRGIPLLKGVPKLSAEDRACIEEMSAIYLDADAVEFSEKDLACNLNALWKLSANENSKMKKSHVRKINGIVAAVYPAIFAPATTQLPAKKRGLEPRQSTFHAKSDIIAPEQPKKLNLFKRMGAKNTLRKMKKLVKKSSEDMDRAMEEIRKGKKKEPEDGKTPWELAIDAYNGNCGEVLRLYKKIPGGNEVKIKAEEALHDYIWTGFCACKERNPRTYEWDMKNAMKYARLMSEYRQELEELNRPDVEEKRGSRYTPFGTLANEVQQHVFSKIRAELDFISTRGRNEPATYVLKDYPYLEECAKMAKKTRNVSRDTFEKDYRGDVLEYIRKNLDGLFSGHNADLPLGWANEIMKLSPDFYKAENLDERLWKAWEPEIMFGAYAAQAFGDQDELKRVFDRIREHSPQFSERAEKFAAELISGKTKASSTEAVRAALKTLEFPDDADFDKMELGEITKQYQKLIRMYHTDKRPDLKAGDTEYEELTAKSQMITEAYGLLDRIKRPRT